MTDLVRFTTAIQGRGPHRERLVLCRVGANYAIRLQYLPDNGNPYYADGYFGCAVDVSVLDDIWDKYSARFPRDGQLPFMGMGLMPPGA